MMADDAGPTPTEASAATRMALLEAQGHDLSAQEALTLAVQQAPAGMGALGGLVRLRDTDGAFRLAVAAGTDPGDHRPAVQPVPARQPFSRERPSQSERSRTPGRAKK